MMHTKDCKFQTISVKIYWLQNLQLLQSKGLDYYEWLVNDLEFQLLNSLEQEY